MTLLPAVRLPSPPNLRVSALASACIVAAAIIAFLHIGREC